MRIISDYNDYYDSVQKFGQDQSVIYLRKTISYSKNDVYKLNSGDNKEGLNLAFNFTSSIFNSFKDYYDFYDYYRCIMTDKGQLVYEFKIIYFCGKACPIIKFAKRFDESHEYKDTYLYTEDNLNSFFVDNDVINYYAKNMSAYENKRIIDVFKRLKTWLNQKISIESDWFIKYKIISIYCFENIFQDRRYVDSLVINPILKNIQFFKLMDAYTAYQELDMYISGTLSYPQNAMVEVSDEQKVLKHGFDPKYGFRKRKNA